MLGIMRKYKQSVVIKVVFGVIVLSFIGTIFLVWGKGDRGMTPSSYAVKVNGTKIPYEQFQRSYYRLRDIYSQIYGQSLSPEIEKQLNIKKMALDTIIDSELARNEAKHMGIKVTDDEVQKAVAAVPAFQKDGAFNFDQYVQVLKVNRITPKDFEESQKEDLLVKKARDKVKERAKVTDEEALQSFKKQNDKIDLSFASFSAEEVKSEVKLTDQELSEYLQKHPEEFKTPEQVSIAYVLVDPLKLSSGAEVTESDIQTWYQKHIDRYQGKGGILPLAEVKERVKTDAQRFKAGQKAYETVADAINKNRTSGNLGAVATALGAKPAETALFTAAQPAPALAGENELIRKALLLKENELGGPVETPKGIYVLKLKEKKPADVPPLAQIRGKVEERAKAAKAIELAKKKAEEAQAKLAKGDASLKLQQTGSFGFDAKGNVPNIGTSPDLMEAAFKLTTAAPAPTSPVKIGNRWYAVKLKQRTEASTATFQAEKEKIRQSLLPKKQEEELDKWMKELKAKAKIEINPALQKD